MKKLHGENRPLDEDQRGVIDANRHALLPLIDLKRGIVDRLYNGKCFNEWHKKYIERGEGEDKVNRLLDIVRRRSVANFNKLVEALRDDQPHVAQMLAEGGGKSITVYTRYYKFYNNNNNNNNNKNFYSAIMLWLQRRWRTHTVMNRQMRTDKFSV